MTSSCCTDGETIGAADVNDLEVDEVFYDRGNFHILCCIS